MKRLHVFAMLGALLALAGCQGSPNIALPPPPAPRAFVTNAHHGPNVLVICCGCVGCPCCFFTVGPNCGGGFAVHRHPLAGRRHVHPLAGRRQVHPLALRRPADGRRPLLVAANLLNVYNAPLTPSGSSTFSLGAPSGLLGHPGGVAFDSAGSLYVADFARNTAAGVNGTIFVFSPTVGAGSHAAFSFPLPGSANGFSIAFDRQGNLWASDTCGGVVCSGNGTLYKFTPPFSACSTPAFTWHNSCAGCNPAGIAFDRSGAMYVAEEDFGISVWQASRLNCACNPDADACIHVCGSWGCAPESVALDVSQRLFVGFRDSGNIRVLNPPFGTSTGGNFTIPAPGILLTAGFMLFDQSNNLYVPYAGDKGPNSGGLAVFIPPYSSSSTPIFVLTTGLNNPYGIAFGR
jgi:DNA-binding beta-propeller fold protein YncE